MTEDRSRGDRGRSALLLGATGLVGSHCLDLLLDDPAYGEVRVAARRRPENRVKGEMEATVKLLPFRAVWIIRPSLLLGERAEMRRGERIAAALARPLGPLMLGSLRRYRPIEAREVAQAMVRLARSGGTGGVVESEEIRGVARG